MTKTTIELALSAGWPEIALNIAKGTEDMARLERLIGLVRAEDEDLMRQALKSLSLLHVMLQVGMPEFGADDMLDVVNNEINALKARLGVE